MIRLLDDFTHIGFACTRLQENPEDRFAVVGLNCILGENITHTRIASLIVILLTLMILDFTFFRNRNWRRPLLMALHPLILIPFFWASQISTSLTTLFAAVWAFFAVAWIEGTKGNRPWWAWLFIPASGACILVRQETVAYCGVFAILWGIQHWRTIKDRPGAVLSAIFLSVGGFQLAKKLFFKTGFTTIASSPLIQNISNSLAGEGSTTPDYPVPSWPFLQLDSTLRYLEGLLLPWRTSFYGNWYKWWEIHQNPFKTALQFAAFAGLIALSLWITRNLLRKKGRGSDIVSRMSLGLAFFTGSSLLLSAVPRSDWYYPARAYLGSLAFFIWVSPLLIRNGRIFAIFGIAFSASSLAHGIFHFQDDRSFVAYETEITGANHPYLDLLDADQKLKSGQGEEAIKSLFKIYSLISKDSAAASLRAGFFWSEGLYEAWRTYSLLGNETKALEVYRVLQNSTYFQSTHACLQIPSIPVEECLAEDRKSHFCESFSLSYPRTKTVRPYRLEPEKICGYKPNQGD